MSKEVMYAPSTFPIDPQEPQTPITEPKVFRLNQTDTREKQHGNAADCTSPLVAQRKSITGSFTGA
jgi:hypothetical protein